MPQTQVENVFSNDLDMPPQPQASQASQATPATSLTSELWREPAIAASAGVKGLAGLLGSGGDLENLAGRAANALGVPWGKGTFFPTSDQLVGLTDRLGLTDNPALAPRNTAERLTGEIAGGVGSVAPMLLAPESVLSKGLLAAPRTLAGKAALAGGAALAGAGAGELQYANPNGSPLIPLAAGTVLGLLPGAGVSAVRGALALDAKSAAERLANAEAGAQGLRGTNAGAEAADAAERDKAIFDAHVLESQIMQNRAEKLHAAAVVAHPELANVPHENLTDATGQIGQEIGKAWMDDLSNKLAAIHSPIDKLMPENTPTPLTNFISRVEQALPAAGIVGPTREVVTPTGLTRLYKRVIGNTPEEDAALAERNEAILARGRDVKPKLPSGKPEIVPLKDSRDATWREARLLRSSFGEALGDKLVRDIPKKLKASFYQALSSDERAALTAKLSTLSPEALGGKPPEYYTQLYDAIKARAHDLYSSTEDLYAPLAESDAPGARLRRILSASALDAKTLAKIRAESPRLADALAVNALRAKVPGEELWHSLPETTREALVPSAEHRAAIARAHSTELPDIPAIEAAAKRRFAFKASQRKSSGEELADEIAQRRATLSDIRARRAKTLKHAAGFGGVGAALGAALGAGMSPSEIATHLIANGLGAVATPALGGNALLGAAIGTAPYAFSHALRGPAGVAALPAAILGARAGETQSRAKP